MSSDVPQCPHCGETLKKWTTPQLTCWGTAYHYVCFNDECPYYVKGWDWMLTQFQQKASYRYRLDPSTGEEGPVPVWSPDALKNGIIQENNK